MLGFKTTANIEIVLALPCFTGLPVSQKEEKEMDCLFTVIIFNCLLSVIIFKALYDMVWSFPFLSMEVRRPR